MILARASRFFIAVMTGLGTASVSSVAYADVLEVSSDGARWVAGGENAASPDLATADGIIIGEEANAPQRVTPELLAEFDSQDSIETLETLPPEALGNVEANAAAIPPKYAAKLQELSRRFDLSASLLEALVWQESRWRENAVSHAGARGLAQLMPATARYLGVDPDDPMQNLEGGARYLREQLDRFDGDLEKALAAYNAGPGRVIRANGIPNIRETKQYVAAIMGRLASHSRSDQAQ